VLTSGGVSVGEEDHVKPAVQALGGLNLWQISMKPGKPFAFGFLKSQASDHSAFFMGLPGNPVSSFVTFQLLVRPFLLALQGVRKVQAMPLQLKANFDMPKPDKRREFLRVKRNSQGGLDLFPNQSSGVLTSVVWGDGVTWFISILSLSGFNEDHFAFLCIIARGHWSFARRASHHSTQCGSSAR
jgi:molybdopterin molybdotransferase